MEAIKTADSRMYSLVVLYDMHTRFYHNVLAGISDKDAHNRMQTNANHIAWIAGSLVHERFSLVEVLGLDASGENDRSKELFKDHHGIQEAAVYPALDIYKKDWELISPVLKQKLLSVDATALNGPDPYQMPGEETNLFDTLAFIIDRESYCIGQLGLYRRLLGYEAMKYQ